MSTWRPQAVQWALNKWGGLAAPTGGTPTGLIDVSRDHSAAWHAYAVPHTGGTRAISEAVGRIATEWATVRSDLSGRNPASNTDSGWWPWSARDATELQIIDGTVSCDVATWPRWTATMTVADPGVGNRELVAPYGTAIKLEWRNNYATPSGSWGYECAGQQPGGPVVWPAWWMCPLQIVESQYNAVDGTYSLRCEDLTGIMTRQVWPRADLTWGDLQRNTPFDNTLFVAFWWAEAVAYMEAGLNDYTSLLDAADARVWDNRKAFKLTDPVPGGNVMETLDAVASMGGFDLGLQVGHSMIGDKAQGQQYWNMQGGTDPAYALGTPTGKGSWATLSIVPEIDTFPDDDVQYDISVTQNVVSWGRLQSLRPNEWWNSYTIETDGSDDKTRVGVGRVTGGPTRWERTGRVVVQNQIDAGEISDANGWTRTERDAAARRNLRRARRRWIIDEIEAVPDPGLREGMRVKFRHASGEYRRGFVRGLRHDLTGANPMIVSIGSDLADETDTP